MRNLLKLLSAILLLGFSYLPAQEVDMSKLNALKFRNIGPAGMSGRVTAIDVVLRNKTAQACGNQFDALTAFEFAMGMMRICRSYQVKLQTKNSNTCRKSHQFIHNKTPIYSQWRDVIEN